MVVLKYVMTQLITQPENDHDNRKSMVCITWGSVGIPMLSLKRYGCHLNNPQFLMHVESSSRPQFCRLLAPYTAHRVGGG